MFDTIVSSSSYAVSALQTLLLMGRRNLIRVRVHFNDAPRPQRNTPAKATLRGNRTDQEIPRAHEPRRALTPAP